MAIQWQPPALSIAAALWRGGYVNEDGGLEWQPSVNGYINEQPAGGGTTVTVTAGTITYGGQSITVSAATVLPVSAGAITYAGQAIGVVTGTVVAVSAGAVVYAGQLIQVLAVIVTAGRRAGGLLGGLINFARLGALSGR